MFEKMTDGDAMVYIRNTMLAALQLAQERQIPINIYTGEEGYVMARMGDYTVTRYPGGRIEYDYEPICKEAESTKDCIYGIPPQSIRFGRPPKEES